MAIGAHRLAQQLGAITKRMTVIEEMAGMDMLFGDKKFSLIEVFTKGVDADTVVLTAAQASRTENQDVIDTAIVGMLADPKEARAGIQELHFLHFNPTDKRTALTYLDRDGKMHRVSKGAPEQTGVCGCIPGSSGREKRKCWRTLAVYRSPASL